MPITLHHHSNMTLHMNQLLHPFYILCRLGEAAGSCDGKHMGKVHTENHCTAQISSLWGVALRPWCGHCPAHSHLGRDQYYASQAVRVFRMSDTKQQSTTGRENVAIHCVREGRPRRGNIWTMHIFLRDGDVGTILNGAESHQPLDATEVRGTLHHFLLHFLRRRLGQSTVYSGWKQSADW